MILPNQLTILRIILTPIFLFLFLSADPLLNQISLAVFIIAALTDWYDGWLARKFNYITNWGKFWDPLADKILTSTAFIGFYIIDIIPLWMVIVILVRDFVITTIRAFADYKGKTFPTSYYAKWKTFLQMTFLYYLLLIRTGEKIPQIYNGNENIFYMLFDSTFIFVTMLVITIITLHSGITYIFNNKNLIKRLFIEQN
ncbi:MAG: CDP-diacylglycerol--glycerol-3-phosphate 3-phosphatidyltransferase [Ignavibacteriales bacterium CG_4_9_14_3_um_filter_30_11]|nr:MAG: CDP-diacylglycerol--glycerol-3-phosphate 3-phosphatidyltransferase [Ignavibacteriales bacterium CG_4_9_14_3_um_filter_30_11]